MLDSDDMVLRLHGAPVDPRTGNKVLYAQSWVANRESMIGKINPDWVRRELDWFNSGSDRLEDMEAPVPKLFEACAGWDGKVNSAYGHILFYPADVTYTMLPPLYQRVVDAFKKEGLATRHAVAIISDRDIHYLATYNGRNDFICTNALNFMIDADNRLHIVAQMRSMDAVFGYRADYSMWDDLMNRLLQDLNVLPEVDEVITRGDIIFQVANLHVYPRHFTLLDKWTDVVYDRQEAESRSVWAKNMEDAREAFSAQLNKNLEDIRETTGLSVEAAKELQERVNHAIQRQVDHAAFYGGDSAFRRGEEDVDVADQRVATEEALRNGTFHITDPLTVQDAEESLEDESRHGL